MLLATLVLSSIGGIVAVVVLYYGQQAAVAEPSIPPGAALSSWFENGQGGRHVLQIWQGSAPAEGVRVAGVVATDTNCEPDAKGLSHCHNRIDLDNGRSIEVIHTHLMSRNPCLAPGQRISIARLDAEWLLGFEGQASRTN
jgi:hypothetical protein